MTSTVPVEGQLLQKLHGWLESGGARIAGLEVRRDAAGVRGAHAVSPIPAHRVVLRIPRRYLLTEEIARASRVGRRIAGSGAILRGGQSTLAAFLLEERRDAGSFWRPYLDTLPSSLEHIPLFFGPGALTLLQGSFTARRIEEMRAALTREYHDLCQRVPELAEHGSAAFLWARAVVTSRVFGLTIDGRATDALVPLADMLNHRRPRETGWTYAPRDEGFVVTSLRSFSTGEEVCDSYGRKCNSRFFLHYGFCLEDNDDNEAAIALPVPAAGPSLARRLELLGCAGGPPARELRIPARGDHPRLPKMLSLLRVAVAERAELGRMRRPDLDVNNVPPVSARNEVAALHLLARSCEAAVAAFETTLNDDDELLRRSDLSAVTRSCVVMRRGEKRALRAQARLARAIAVALERPPEALGAALAEQHPGGAAVTHYLRAVLPHLVGKLDGR
jgi:protein-histidine N-methyltransferase